MQVEGCPLDAFGKHRRAVRRGPPRRRPPAQVVVTQAQGETRDLAPVPPILRQRAEVGRQRRLQRGRLVRRRLRSRLGPEPRESQQAGAASEH